MKKGRRKLSEKVVIIHGQFVTYGRNAREWMRKCEMLLPHVERERVWEKKGYESIYHYAAVLSGMSHPKVDEALRVIKKIEDKPELMKVAEEKGLQAVRPVAAIATSETASFWAEKSAALSKHTLETYVKEWKILNLKAENEDSIQANFLPGEEINITISLKPETLSQLEKLKGQGDWDTLMQEFLKLREEKLEAEKPVAVKVVKKTEKKSEMVIGAKGKSKAYHSRPAPKKIQQFVIKKTNGQCAFPGCKKPHEIFHHAERFALNPEHNPDTLHPLCKEHEQLVHNGLVENEDMEPKYWKVREFADKSDVKWQIDEKVQKYRQR